MAWEVEYSDEFGEWWADLDLDVQDAVHTSVTKLSAKGPTLGFPDSSQIKSSKFGEMRELRVQCNGEPWRVFYAFDPRRTAYLILGGCKVGKDRFYEAMVPMVDRIFEHHLQEVRER